MLKLSDFLKIDEGVEFQINNTSKLYKIENNTLKCLCHNDEWKDCKMILNDIVNAAFSFPVKVILTKEEKQVLKKVILESKNKVKEIVKILVDDCSYMEYEYIYIRFEDGTGISLPLFEKGEQFKNMVPDTPYILKNLMLEE